LNKNPADIENHNVTGSSYQPEGAISDIQNGDVSKRRGLRTFLESMYLNNDAKLLRDEAAGRIVRNGLPTEAALKVLVEKTAQYETNNGADKSRPEGFGEYLSQDFEKVTTLEFTRDRKCMSVLTARKSTGKNVLFIKGAPDYLIKNANQAILSDGSIKSITNSDKDAIMRRIADMAR
jgi:magnesium-transporting ATPase (P-type)